MKVARAILLMIAGAVIGNIASAVSARVWTYVEEMSCQGTRLVAEGKALRLSAIERRQIHWHVEANRRFEQAAQCHPEATAHLGQAHCYGWGVPLNRRRGMRMILDAVRKDARLEGEWLGNQLVCPDVPAEGGAWKPSPRPDHRRREAFMRGRPPESRPLLLSRVHLRRQHHHFRDLLLGHRGRE
jgi:hypothetical protein